MRNQSRRSIRLPGFDYAEAGAYFVTICVEGKECRLGEVVGGEMRFDRLGELANESWPWLQGMFSAVSVPVYCVMPNHAHAVIMISEPEEVGGSDGRGGVSPPSTTGEPPSPLKSKAGEGTSPLQKPTLGQIVASYKYATTKAINQHTESPGVRFWQRNYYERVIRNEREFEAIYDYI